MHCTKKKKKEKRKAIEKLTKSTTSTKTAIALQFDQIHKIFKKNLSRRLITL